MAGSKGAGRFVWHDCMSTNAEAAGEFYTKLLGWGQDIMEVAPGMNYGMFTVGGQPHAG